MTPPPEPDRVGGYGRRELFPYSDIDIMVLLDSERRCPASGCTGAIFHLSLGHWPEPGHSVRTLKECVRQAMDDQTIITSLMECG